ncbi:MAG: hypothetical protein R3F19_11960 [Verrucomicrobiales bacterium]
MAALVDGYLVDGMIVFNGLQKGGYVGRGFRVHAPDCENSDVTWLNRMEDELRVLLASLKDTTRMQVQWSVDSDYKRELLDYYEQTKKRSTNAWSARQRNERFTRYWAKMEQRQLRRERLHLYVVSKVDTGSAPHGAREGEVSSNSRGGGQRAAYDYVLGSSARELQQYGELFDQIFRGIGGDARPLDDQGHFEELYRFFNPSAPDNPRLDYGTLFDPGASIVENCFNGEASPLSKPDFGFYLDGYYHGMLVIKSLPKTTFSGMIEMLTSLPMLDYSITVNIRPLDVMREIEKEEGAYEKLQHTIQHSPKLRMLAAMHKKGQKIARLMSNEVLPYQAQFIIRAWDREKAGLRAKLAALRGAISKLNGAKVYDPALPTSARNYFFSSIPGWCWSKYDDYAHYIEDVNLANLLPISATPTGDLIGAEALYDGANRNLIGVKTFDGSAGHESPLHGVMFGMSGAGKSVNVIDLLTQTEPYYDYTVVIEEGLSYGIYTQTVEDGAKPIIIQPNGNLTFNYLDTQGLPLTALQIANATALCQVMIGTQADEDKNRMRAAHLSNAIRQLYRDCYDDWARKHPEENHKVARHAAVLHQWMREKLPPGATLFDAFVSFRDEAHANSVQEREAFAAIEDGDIDRLTHDPATADDVFRLALAYLKPHEFPTHAQLQELLVLESHGANGEESRFLAKLLEPWCAFGNYGAILDGTNNVNLAGRIAHFELGSIPESAEDLRSVAAFLITNHVRNEVMSRPRSTRKRVILEELSAFLAIPNGDRITREFYERMRKYNCWVFSVIQQFSRFHDSPVRSSVMGNSRLLFLLKQRDRQDLDRISEAFPLPDVTKSTIASFPVPTSQQSRPYAAFVYYRDGDGKPTIVNARNEASKEMLYASASNGAIFEQRARELNGLPVVDGIVERAGRG